MGLVGLIEINRNHGQASLLYCIVLYIRLMSLFSKSRKNQPETTSSDVPPEQATTPQAEPAPAPWAMTEEQYNVLLKKLDKIDERQRVIDENVRKLFGLYNNIDSLHSDVRVSISNELLLIQRQDEQTTDIRQIKRVVNS